MLFNSRLEKKSGFEINQLYFKYLNSNDEPSSTLMQFVKFLNEINGVMYKAEDMSVFQRAFKVRVVSYFKDGYL